MSDVAIRVEGLGKRYRLGERAPYKTLRESLTRAASAPFRALAARANGSREQSTAGDKKHIWALKDVSLEVKRGEAVGIIGRNGSGKSTLLKILARVTEPTTGYAEIRGRVGSLLEVGTGFHPELTGRENVYLNGAILGMTKAEIRRRFDEIVAFAEIERFLDTPVKRYSSGMYVRLAFAVAAHLDPEILLVDEVLAVGDAAFQRKCLGRMEAVAGEGRTVVFVTHSMPAITSVCSRGLLLADGTSRHTGTIGDVVNTYIGAEMHSSTGLFPLESPSLRVRSVESSRFKWTCLAVVNSKGVPSRALELREPFSLILEAHCAAPVQGVDIGFSIESLMGESLFNSHAPEAGMPTDFAAGSVRFRISLEPNLLGPGTYTIGLTANGDGVADSIDVAGTITVLDTSSNPAITVPSSYRGVVLQPCQWSVAREGK